MPELTHSYPQSAVSDFTTNALPISSIVRALCQAATTGPDLLYEVMLKLSLLVEATAPMYGLSIWSLENGQRPALEWAEGLQEAELASRRKGRWRHHEFDRLMAHRQRRGFLRLLRFGLY